MSSPFLSQGVNVTNGSMQVNLRDSSGNEITSLGGGKMSSAAFATGTLPNATPFPISMANAPLPATVCLKSSDAGRLIEWSADGGVTYFSAIYDYTTASQLVYFANMPITHIRLTGAAAGADTYRIT